MSIEGSKINNTSNHRGFDLLGKIYHLDSRLKEGHKRMTQIPNGQLEIAVNLGDPLFVKYGDSDWVQRPTISILYGNFTSKKIKCAGRSTKTIGISISLSQLTSIVPEIQNRIFDKYLDLQIEFPEKTTSFLSRFNRRIELNDKINEFELFVADLRSESITHPAFLEYSINLIRQSKGQDTVEELANRVGCSARHLRRCFVKHFGISPKEYSSLVRLYDAVQRIGSNKNSMADVISDKGYFDRAHFYKEFVRIAGMSPSAYFKENRFSSTKYIDVSQEPTHEYAR